jgi:hypothetical protein
VTSWFTAADTVRTRFDTEITQALSVPTIHDNHDVAPPDNALFVRFTIQPGATRQLELGASGRTFRSDWRAVASIFSPLALGDAAVLQLADNIATAFRATTVDAITYLTPSLGQLARSGDTWHMNVTIPFTVEALA